MRTTSLFVFTLLIAGCGAPWTTVVQSGPPSAIAGATQVSYAADFDSSTLDEQPLNQLLAQASPDERSSIESALREMDQEFLQAFASEVDVPVVPAAGSPQPGEVRLTAVFAHIQRGARGPIGAPTRVTMRFRFSVDGQVTDEAEASCRIGPSLARSSATRRMNACARKLGGYAARYFDSERQR